MKALFNIMIFIGFGSVLGQTGENPAFPMDLPSKYIADTIKLDNGNMSITYWKDSLEMKSETSTPIGKDILSTDGIVLMYARNLKGINYSLLNSIKGELKLLTTEMNNIITMYYYDENGLISYIGQYNSESDKEEGWHYEYDNGELTEKKYYINGVESKSE